MVLTVSFALSPVIGLCCHRRQRKASANLTPASRRQDHTTSPSASARFVKHATASIASRAYVRDDRDTPLMWDGMARLIVLIWVRPETECFCKQDWTAQIRLIRFNKSGF